MAITPSVSDWTAANVSKTLSIQSALTSKLRCYKIKCTAGASDTYATGGISADVKQGRVSTLVSVIPETTSLGYVVKYDKVNSKIQLYSVGGTAGALLVEVANSTSITSGATFEFLVFGF